MSVGALAIGEAPVGAQQPATDGVNKGPPRRRVVIATSDLIAPPEPR